MSITLRPWEANQLLPLYNRTVSITRPNTTQDVGAVAYSGVRAAQEGVIATNVPASIQLDRQGERPVGGLPGDAQGRGTWKIFMVLPRGTVQDRDVVTDDLGNRYRIANAWFDILGYNCLAEKVGA